jgi:hypothetical protein
MPIRFGRAASSWIAAASAAVAILCSLAFPFAAPVRHVLIYLALAASAGLFLLVLPGLRWLRVQSTEAAMAYFNRACFYPLAMFAVLAISLVI